MSGFGRGGRGQALLKALEQPTRRPGQPPAPQQQLTQAQNGYSAEGQPHQHSPPRPSPSILPPSPPQPSPPAFPTSPPQSIPPLLPTSPPQQQPPPMMRPVGRGIASLASPQTPKEHPLPSQLPGGVGRGLVPLTSHPGSPPQPHQQQLHSMPPSGRAALLKQQPQQLRSPQQLTVRQPGGGGGTAGVEAITQGMGGLSTVSAEQQMARRGTSGKTVPLNANYVMLKGRSEGVFQYAVSFEPVVESKNMRFQLLNEHRPVIGNTRAFDGSILYLPKKITDTTLTCTSTRPTDGAQIAVSITLVALVQYSECMQLFNVIFRRLLRALDLKQVSRYYYDPHNPIAIPQHKMELWPGYVSAISQYDGGLMLMFDSAHKLLRTDSALDFLYELYSSYQNRFQEMATKHLVGCVVLTRYNNRTYRVDDIAWDKNPQSTFIDHTGQPVSFIDYYMQAYGKVIQDTEQPLLIHRPKRRRIEVKGQEAPEEVICLVPELCCMTGLTDMARADFKVMKDIAIHTRISPNHRQLVFKKFLERVNQSPKAREELESWGLQLDMQMIDIEGRKLPLEKIFFRNKTIIANEEADWGRDAVKEHVISPVPLQNWILVVTRRDQTKAMDFLNMMKRVGPPMGIEVHDAKVLEVPNDRTETYLQAIRSEIGPKLQLVVTIFPTSRDDRYSAMKKLCCIDSPVPSQVINARTISQPQKLRSVTQKIALQINCKLGGELWALEIPLKNLMVIGVDVYHDSSNGKKRSIAGFVASTNQHLTRWYSRVVIQSPQQEIMDGLKLCLQASLKKFHEENQTLPDRIFVFRDGVGDGQMATVADYEVPQISSCFSMFGENYQPKLAVVVVQKRISTRIFGKGPKGLDNPPPGTIVDHTITRKGWYDFFLVSQHVRQGTVTPTHYNVVYDNSGLKPDHMQRLSYKLTHMYYNWPGTIRVPAPCQYAHKLAFLVGQSLHRDPSLDLSDRLFFL